MNHDIDIAVHSHKDLETSTPEGLITAAVSQRANPCELLLIRKSAHAPNALWELKKKRLWVHQLPPEISAISTRSDVEIKDLRECSNQVAKSGEYDAILLAKAGVERLKLDLSDLITVDLTPDEFVPAPTQGVLAIQIREQDKELHQILQKINDAEVQKLVHLEQEVLRLMDGGCQLPLGVLRQQICSCSLFDYAMHASRYFRFPYKDTPDFPAKIVEHLQHQQI